MTQSIYLVVGEGKVLFSRNIKPGMIGLGIALKIFSRLINPVCPFDIYLFIYLFICLFIYLFIYLFIPSLLIFVAVAIIATVAFVVGVILAFCVCVVIIVANLMLMFSILVLLWVPYFTVNTVNFYNSPAVINLSVSFLTKWDFWVQLLCTLVSF